MFNNFVQKGSVLYIYLQMLWQGLKKKKKKKKVDTYNHFDQFISKVPDTLHKIHARLHFYWLHSNNAKSKNILKCNIFLKADTHKSRLITNLIIKKYLFLH